MSTLYTELAEKVMQAINGLQKEGFLPQDIDTSRISVEQPKDKSHGDFATNAAMILAKPAGKNPRDVAEKIATAIRAANGGIVEKIDIAGPGFLNFTLTRDKFIDQVNKIHDLSDLYGKSQFGGDERIMVEFVSANPTGPLHFGHARGAVYGDVLCRLLQMAGYDVTREYVVNDAGVQVGEFAKSVYAAWYGIEHEDIQYKGDYVREAAESAHDLLGDDVFAASPMLDEHGLPVTPPRLLDAVVAGQMAIIKEDLDLAGVHFDDEHFFSEKAMHDRGESTQAEMQLREKDLIYEGTLPPPKGKEVDDYEPVELTLFKASEFGDDVNRPLKKADGNWTYFGADVAYHMNKLNRGHKQLINVWGADHAGAVKRLQAAIKGLTGKNALEIQLMQMVRLFRGGEPVKMSKRAGNFVTFREVVEEVGKDAVRFSLLMRKQDSQLDFDLQKAIEKNNDNPVFYVQYAHARMCSVYRQQAEMGIKALSLAQTDLSLLETEHEMDLLRHLCAWPMIVERAAQAREPHRIAFFVHELAARFHSWYNADKFLLEDNIPLTHARLALVKAAQTVLVNGLNILGVSAPEKM